MTELQLDGHRRQAEKLRQLWQTKQFRQNVAKGQILSGHNPTEKTLCTSNKAQYIIAIERKIS